MYVCISTYVHIQVNSLKLAYTAPLEKCQKLYEKKNEHWPFFSLSAIRGTCWDTAKISHWPEVVVEVAPMLPHVYFRGGAAHGLTVAIRRRTALCRCFLLWGFLFVQRGKINNTRAQPFDVARVVVRRSWSQDWDCLLLLLLTSANTKLSG